MINSCGPRRLSERQIWPTSQSLSTTVLHLCRSVTTAVEVC